jgi:hypothetical protein
VIVVEVAKDASDPHVAIDALIDSGADTSVISPFIVDRLGLDPVKEGRIDAFREGVRVAARVRIHQFHLLMPDGVGSGSLQALECEFNPGQEYIMLGRDVLNMWRVTLDGPGLSGEISV